MLQFTKAHAYGNDFLYVHARNVEPDTAVDALARELCERQTGAGADGLILYEPTADGASMRLVNAVTIYLESDFAPQTNEHASMVDVMGIGTLIRLTAKNGERQAAMVTGGGSYLSSSDKRVHFGLGAERTIALLEIRWPSGILQRLKNVRADQILTVREQAR